MLLSVDRSDLVQICAGFTLVQEARGDQYSEATAKAIRAEWIRIQLQNGGKLASLPTSFTTLSISTFGSSLGWWTEARSSKPTSSRPAIRLFVLPPRSPKLNGHVERAQRTHTEEFYELYDGELDMAPLNQALLDWERVYNTVRPHYPLDGLTPSEYLVKCHPEVLVSLTLPRY